MLSRALVELTKGRLREFSREPSALFFVLFMPLLWMVILGISFSHRQAEHYSIALKQSSAELTPFEKELVQVLSTNPQLNLKQGNEEQIQTWRKKGQILLEITQEDDHIHYAIDETRPEAQRAHLFINTLLQNHFGRKDPVLSSESFYVTKGQRYIDFLIPGLLALSLFTTSLHGTGMTLVANRREGLLKRYRVTPMSSFEFFLSHVLGRFIISIVEILSITLTGMLLFNFTIEGSWLDYFLVASLGTACFTALGILCGSRFSNTGTYNGVVNLIILLVKYFI